MQLKGTSASVQQVLQESDSLFVPVSEIRPNKSRPGYKPSHASFSVGGRIQMQ